MLLPADLEFPGRLSDPEVLSLHPSPVLPALPVVRSHLLLLLALALPCRPLLLCCRLHLPVLADQSLRLHPLAPAAPEDLEVPSRPVVPEVQELGCRELA